MLFPGITILSSSPYIDLPPLRYNEQNILHIFYRNLNMRATVSSRDLCSWQGPWQVLGKFEWMVINDTVILDDVPSIFPKIPINSKLAIPCWWKIREIVITYCLCHPLIKTQSMEMMINMHVKIKLGENESWFIHNTNIKIISQYKR